MCEASDAARKALDLDCSKNYPNAQQVITYNEYSSTSLFNCHGFTFIRTQGGPDRWLGYYPGNRDPDVYLDGYYGDGSYKRVNSMQYPGGIVFWGRPGDHSAVVNSQGSVTSKWGDGPLMVHSVNYGPYGNSNLEY